MRHDDPQDKNTPSRRESTGNQEKGNNMSLRAVEGCPGVMFCSVRYGRAAVPFLNLDGVLLAERHSRQVIFHIAPAYLETVNGRCSL